MPLADATVAGLSELARSELVGFPLRWAVRTLTDRAFRSRKLEPHYAFEVNGLQTLLDLVDVGLAAGAMLEPPGNARDARG